MLKLFMKPVYGLWKLVPTSLQNFIRAALSDTFLVGVMGVVIDPEEKVLLVRHSYKREHEWGLPGGSIKRGEEFEHALYREIKEETGIEVNVGPLLQVFAPVEKPVVDCVFTCSPQFPQQPKPDGGEILEARFFSWGQYPVSLTIEESIAIEKAYQLRRGEARAIGIGGS